jgi:hypothetical protein
MEDVAVYGMIILKQCFKKIRRSGMGWNDLAQDWEK